MLSKLSVILLSVSVTLYISLCLLLRWGQTKLIFFPDSHIESTPQDYGLNYQDVWLSLGKDRVHGWWIPAAQVSTPTLLYFHGNGSNNGDLTQIAAILHQLEVSILLIDYRGYGKSSPVFPNETRVYEDAEAAWQYLTQKRKIKPQQIFVYGHSLGGAIAIELASKHPDLAGLITEGTFTSIQNMVGLMPGIKIFPLSLLITQRFDSITKIKSLQTPILILHGAGDRTIPPLMAKELYAAAPEPKYIEIFARAGHNNLPELNEQKYLLVLQQFMESTNNK
ncbi:phospholipase [Pleurocapsa sp. CCALA 161]|uniref:alpha/beta hydrolase n=1 Tax=Pleurocapsa sp. CCALA 161 TaxID=2107688 RepID=UPI000D081E1C|nr:alpha/beta hydrolase [Pleurocapsa sp. CCALA 161]PSB10760.1 phospholipase [Pleurocapsa sp. CCALA 161]